MEKGREKELWPVHTCLAMAIGRDTSAIAQKIRKSVSLVTKWKEPPVSKENPEYSGFTSPLHKIVELIDTITDIDPERAQIIIVWLNLRFGYLPPAKALDNVENDMDIARSLMQLQVKIGDATASISSILDDGIVQEHEVAESISKGMEYMRAFLEVVEKYKKRISHHE